MVTTVYRQKWTAVRLFQTDTESDAFKRPLLSFWASVSSSQLTAERIAAFSSSLQMLLESLLPLWREPSVHSSLTLEEMKFFHPEKWSWWGIKLQTSDGILPHNARVSALTLALNLCNFYSHNNHAHVIKLWCRGTAVNLRSEILRFGFRLIRSR